MPDHVQLPPSDLAPSATVTSFRPADSGKEASHFRPWYPVTEPVSPPVTALEKERESDTPPRLVPSRKVVEADSLPSILTLLESVDPLLVTRRAAESGILSEAETLSRAGCQIEGELVATQSPLLTSLFQAIGQEIKGQEHVPEDSGSAPKLCSRPLRYGHFLPPNKKLRPFPKPTPPFSAGALPSSTLKLSESDKSLILPSHEGRSNVSLTASLSDKSLSEWEELLRYALESASLAERFSTTLFKEEKGALPDKTSFSPEEKEALLLASCSSMRATLHGLARAYHNVILARRDAVLAKAKSRISAAEKDTLRALPLDAVSLFGSGVAQTPSLQPPSESSKALMEVARALSQRKAPQQQASGQRQTQPNTPNKQKRKFDSPSRAKGQAKKQRFGLGARAQGKKPSAPPSKASAPKSGPHPQ